MTPKFIKLTEQCSDGRGLLIILNTIHIASIKKSTRGSDTLINMGGEKHYFFVKETVAEVEAML